MINFLEAAPEMPMSQALSPYIMIGLMILVLWLFMWRPESKRRKEMEKFRAGLKRGDKIVTAGGIYGVIKEVKDVTVIIEVDNNVSLRMDKTMVQPDPATQTTAKK